MESSVQATKEHCKYCFDVLIAALKQEETPAWPSHLPSTPVPIFVTWKIGQNHDLRGCIGTFSKQELKKVLPEYAIISAFKDSRFSPISMGEVKNLTVAVSLLVNFQTKNSITDWQVGKHGIQIKFGQYGGTYLPEVASEQNWNHEEALRSLVKKAGFRGKYEEVKDYIELTTYESSKESLSYEEYQKMTNK
jgi:AMME syndrome candidate gene 1 protein